MLTALTTVWAFLVAHQATINTDLTILILAMLNHGVGSATVQTWLHLVLDIIAPGTQGGGAARLVGTNATINLGGLKVPLIMRSAAPAAGLELPNSSAGAARAWFPILFLVTAMGACAAVKAIGIDTAQCALGQVPGAVASVVPDVVTSLNGSATDWTNELTTLEGKGVDFAICAIEDAIHEISKAQGGALLAENLRAVDRANVALTQLKQKKVALIFSGRGI